MDVFVTATHTLGFRNLIIFTTLPALLIGGLLWTLGSFLPACSIAESVRLTAPDQRFDLVVFSRSCGTETGANTQAALLPVGDTIPEDAASFLSLGADADLAPRWDGSETIALTIPPGAEIYRQDASVAGVTVVYR